jgi:hypothetical protein
MNIRHVVSLVPTSDFYPEDGTRAFDDRTGYAVTATSLPVADDQPMPGTTAAACSCRGTARHRSAIARKTAPSWFMERRAKMPPASRRRTAGANGRTRGRTTTWQRVLQRYRCRTRCCRKDIPARRRRRNSNIAGTTHRVCLRDWLEALRNDLMFLARL